MYGHSAANFNSHISGNGSAAAAAAPLGLQGQVVFYVDLLREYVRGVRPERGGEGEKEVRVILMGHSVGAYIALEVLRRVQEGRKRGGGGEGQGMRIVGVVGLWPTVTHIARSASGVRMGVSFSCFLVGMHRLVLGSQEWSWGRVGAEIAMTSGY